jgi:energy-coupling factor transport system ATP-binding protein
LLDRLQAEGVTVITITHDMRFVVDAFERVIAMAEGKVAVDGSRRDVFFDDDVLRRARIRRTETAQLARDLGFGEDTVTIDELVERVP